MGADMGPNTYGIINAGLVGVWDFWHLCELQMLQMMLVVAGRVHVVHDSTFRAPN